MGHPGVNSNDAVKLAIPVTRTRAHINVNSV